MATPDPSERREARIDHRECDARIDELRRLVEEHAARIRELERRLGQDSSNSDRPPSTDPPHKPPRAAQKRERGKRRPGGQPGHQGRARELVPPEHVDDIQNHRPLACGECGRKLRGNDPSPLRHQVTELPPVKPTVVEHRLHCLECRCGARTRAELPRGVPQGAFGPRLQALVGLDYLAKSCAAALQGNPAPSLLPSAALAEASSAAA